MNSVQKQVLSSLQYCEESIRARMVVLPRFIIEGAYETNTLYPLLVGKDRAPTLLTLRAFMIWKAAQRFTVAFERRRLGSIFSISISTDAIIGATSRYNKKSLRFGRTKWGGKEMVSREFLNLLPLRSFSVNREEYQTMDAFDRGEKCQNIIFVRGWPPQNGPARGAALRR